MKSSNSKSKLSSTKSKENALVYKGGSSLASTNMLSRAELEVAVRKTNPAELNTAPVAFWDPEGTLRTGAIDNSNVKQQLTIVESGVLYSAKLYNDLKVKNDMLAKTLKKKISDLDEQKRNFESLNAMKRTETDESIRIEELKKEVQQIQDDIDSHTHYSRQLDHIMLRLKNNQLNYDSHMVTMEQTMPSILKEQEDVAHLRRCLGVALGKATLVLEETKTSLAVARKDREGLMRKRLEEMKNAEMLQEWMKRRSDAKNNLVLELRGDLSKDEEEFLKNQIQLKVDELTSLKKANEESTKKLQELENFFLELKQITGVSSMEQVTDKFANQRVGKVELEKEVSDTERKLNHLKKELLRQEQVYEEIKSSGVSPENASRNNTEKLVKDIEDSKNELKLVKAQAERSTNTLLVLQQGANGLLKRLLPFSHELVTNNSDYYHSTNNRNQAPIFNLHMDGGTSKLISSLDALHYADEILTKMMEVIDSYQSTNTLQALTNDSKIEDEDDDLNDPELSARDASDDDGDEGDNDNDEEEARSDIDPREDREKEGEIMTIDPNSSNSSSSEKQQLMDLSLRPDSSSTALLPSASSQALIHNTTTIELKASNTTTTTTSNNNNNNNHNKGSNIGLKKSCVVTSSLVEDEDDIFGSFEQTSELAKINIRIKSRLMNRHDEKKEQDAADDSGLLSLPGSGMKHDRSRGDRHGLKSAEKLKEEILTRELVKTRSERKLKEETQKRMRELKKQKLLQQQGQRRKSYSANLATTAALSPSNTTSMKAPPTATANNNGTAPAGADEIDDEKLAADLEYRIMAMNLAAKEQREYSTRLCSNSKAIPDALNMRADIMTKMKAFFDHQPELD